MHIQRKMHENLFPKLREIKKDFRVHLSRKLMWSICNTSNIEKERKFGFTKRLRRMTWDHFCWIEAYCKLIKYRLLEWLYPVLVLKFRNCSYHISYNYCKIIKIRIWKFKSNFWLMHYPLLLATLSCLLCQNICV